MSATDELRRSLDEHNIEWWSDDDFGPDHTEWATDSVAFSSLGLSEDGRIAIQVICAMTPEQAMEATVGRDMCHMMSGEYSGSVYYDLYECSECGEQIPRTKFMGESTPPKYCPECGKRVVG